MLPEVALTRRTRKLINKIKGYTMLCMCLLTLQCVTGLVLSILYSMKQI